MSWKSVCPFWAIFLQRRTHFWQKWLFNKSYIRIKYHSQCVMVVSKGVLIPFAFLDKITPIFFNIYLHLKIQHFMFLSVLPSSFQAKCSLSMPYNTCVTKFKCAVHIALFSQLLHFTDLWMETQKIDLLFFPLPTRLSCKCSSATLQWQIIFRHKWLHIAWFMIFPNMITVTICCGACGHTFVQLECQL